MSRVTEAKEDKSFKAASNQEMTLDPEDWQSIRQLGHRMVDNMMTYLETLRERPVWQSVPVDIREYFQQSVPDNPQAPETVYREFNKNILPYAKGNIHPRYWGWVEGSGTPFGMLAEMLAAGLNSNLAFGDHSAVYVEEQVMNWCKEMLGYAPDSRGLLVSGGSMANLLGLAVARNAMAPVNIRKKGAQALSGKMTLYCSTETHNSVQKSIELLGIGSDSIRFIPVDKDFRIDLKILKQKIAEDRAAGYFPFCIVGNAGTVNTGAFDPLDTLADICKDENLWFHVDGAFGALIAMLPEMSGRVNGMERADSLAFDLHKWMYMQYEVGCFLVKDKQKLHDAFYLDAGYLIKHDRGIAAGPVLFKDRGPELSRVSRGIKVWMSIKEHGLDKYRNLIRQNMAQARYLGQLVTESPDLELTVPVTLNITCFRFKAHPTDDKINNHINKEILMQLHEKGIAAPSYAMLNGRYVIRAAITNHRSKREDFRALIEEVIKIGKQLMNVT